MTKKFFKDEVFNEHKLALNVHTGGVVFEMENYDGRPHLISLDYDSTMELFEFLKKNYEEIEKRDQNIVGNDQLEKVTEQVFSKLFLLRDSIETAERVHTPQEQSFLNIIDELEIAIVKAEKEKDKIEKCVDAAFDKMMGKDKIDGFLDQGGRINVYPK